MLVLEINSLPFAFDTAPANNNKHNSSSSRLEEDDCKLWTEEEVIDHYDSVYTKYMYVCIYRCSEMLLLNIMHGKLEE